MATVICQLTMKIGREEFVLEGTVKDGKEISVKRVGELTPVKPIGTIREIEADVAKMIPIGSQILDFVTKNLENLPAIGNLATDILNTDVYVTTLELNYNTETKKGDFSIGIVMDLHEGKFGPLTFERFGLAVQTEFGESTA